MSAKALTRIWKGPWRKTVDDLANTPLPQPTLGPGFSDERSLKEKYDHYRTAHEQLVARTDRTFDESRSFIRANGTTPTRHFGEVAGPSGPYHPASAEPLKPAFQEAALQSDAPDQIRITNATAPPDLEHTHDQSRGRR